MPALGEQDVAIDRGDEPGVVHAALCEGRSGLGPVELFDAAGTSLETKTMVLPPLGNDQINRIFRGHDPINGCVDVWTDDPEGRFYCYGSVLDNVTSDPTTIPPQ